MYTVIWKYTVADKNRTDFESTYGAHGTWASLFGKDPAYKGSQLLRDAENEYLLMDHWESQEAYARFLTENRSAYTEMSSKFEKLYSNEERIGGFYLLE